MVVMGLEFSSEDCGVYADGALGHGHLRNRLAELLLAVDNSPLASEAVEVAESLGGEMPDDCWDEDRAIEFLEAATSSDLAWCMQDGDLLLVKILGDQDFGY